MTELPRKRDRRYWFRLLGMFVAAIAAALIWIPFGIGGMMIWGVTHPGCTRSGDPSAYSLAYEDVSFVSPPGFTLSGFFMPGTNGATVVIPPALNGDRGGALEDAAILNRAGFNVLTFDARTCGGAAFHSLGYYEAEDAEAAIDFVKSQPGVDPDRIGLLGFSSAGSTSLFTAARRPDVRAVVAKGGYHNYAALIGVGGGTLWFERLITTGAMTTYRLVTGMDVRLLAPIDALPQIGQRPVLLIYGMREVSLPGAFEMVRFADRNGLNADLYVVDQAGHGDYFSKGGQAYETRLITFFTESLAPTDNNEG